VPDAIRGSEDPFYIEMLWSKLGIGYVPMTVVLLYITVSDGYRCIGVQTVLQKPVAGLIVHLPAL
jgi:hypothetical protein